MATRAGKAYISTRHTDGNGMMPNGPCEPCWRRNLFGGLAEPTGPQRACENEARAILAETERGQTSGAGSAFHRRLDQLTAAYFKDERAALAASLAAILPVLDELEAEAQR